MSRVPVESKRSKEKNGARRISVQGPGQHPGQDPGMRQETISGLRVSKPVARTLPPGLHVVATPIGNLADMTLRAIETLKTADVIACEDTRVTAKLLRAHGISTPTISYHEHNAARAAPRILRRLADGEAVALVSDAGTPLISDPGFKLVREAAARGIHVTANPGASAPLMALVLSGLPSDRFFYAGFLPPRHSARRTELERLGSIGATLIFLESPRRLAAALADMSAVLGPRDICIARELTKLHEEVRRGTLADLAAHYADTPAPRGEIVIVVGPPKDDAATAPDDLDARLHAAIRTMSVRDAAAMVAAASGVPRREVYTRALELASTRSDEEDA